MNKEVIKKYRNKTINLYKKCKKNVINYIKHNRLFLSFILLTFINCFLVRYLTVGNWYNEKTFFIDFAIGVFFGSFAYLIKPNKQFYYLFTLFIVNVLICVINSIYYTWYSSFASFSLLSALGQVGEVGDAIFEKLKIIHFIYLVPIFIFWYINVRLKKKDYFSLVRKIEKGKRLFLYTILVSIMLLGINLSMISKTSYGSLVKQWNRESIVKSFGIVIYQGNDLIQTMGSKLNSLFGYDEASRKFVEYFTNKEKEESDNKYTDIYKGKNVIFMHLESMMTFFVDLKINGQEITPNLNKLTKEGLYFSNFYPEISVGTSSDTELTVNTSLLPVSSGTVFVSYYDRYFESIEKLLSKNGYYTFSMHGNKASMWNRHKMHPSLGYQDMYFEDKYNIDEVVGLGLSDFSFYKQITPILTNIENNHENYMGTIITLSNHTPFEDLDVYGNLLDLTYTTTIVNDDGVKEEVTYDYLEGTKLGNYIKSAHYADKALGEFINSLYENDIMNDTVFVMYGDHDAKLSKNEFNYYYNFDFTTGEIKDEEDPTYIEFDYYQNELNRKTPLIVWTKEDGLKKEVKYYMGMVDVLPTIGNMLGIKNEFALGHDIFETKWNNIIPFPNGNFLTSKVYYNSSKEEYMPLTNSPIDETYIEECKLYTETIIELSNDIIVYDLIKNEGDRIIK
ncbi:MAG: LTA synthase family protein [Bacilli bacterium]|nr:LTA synthase family protein [Bacilli bacterium]